MSEIGDSSETFRTARAGQTSGPKRVVEGPKEGMGWGRGPALPDGRKFKFDIRHARVQEPIPFSVSKLDRLDAEVAGQKLQQILAKFGIQNEDEARILAFMNALFFAHTLNGGSILQPGRGVLRIDGVEFDMATINVILGIETRRFYRAFADEIADANQFIIDNCDPMDPVSMEAYGQLMQVAQERGLQKYPRFAHDSADACIHMSIEERRAVIASKRMVLLGTVNRADEIGDYADARTDREAQSA